MKCDTCGSSAHGCHAYALRYAYTNCGMVMIRTVLPITQAEARRIIAETEVTVAGKYTVALEFRRWVRMIDTTGWTLMTIHDEAVPVATAS